MDSTGSFWTQSHNCMKSNNLFDKYLQEYDKYIIKQEKMATNARHVMSFII